MCNFTKYRNYTFNLKLFLIFLAINPFLYVFPAKNVTLEVKQNAFITPDQKGHFNPSSPNPIVINTDEHILIFDKSMWIDVQREDKSLITCDQNNNILIASKKFIGKLIISVKGNISIDTIIPNCGLHEDDEIDKFFCVDQNTYISTKNVLFKLEGKKLIPLDSSMYGLTVFNSKDKVYSIKPNGIIIRFGNNLRDTLPSCSTLTSNYGILSLLEAEKETVHPTPFYFRWWAWPVYAVVLLVFALLYWRKRKRYFEIEKANLEHIIYERTAELTTEKKKTDDLLANLLPKETVDELKNTGKATSQKFNLVTVLFSDIQGFTKIAEQMNPDKLIDELDNFFFHFDSVVEKYNIEKIKTIGDAYMCAGGIPYKNRTNPVEVVLAALEMQEYMRQLRLKDVNIWDLRIGIHTGAVIAGVVGHKRMSYDIWGDTVNTASRMESSGEAGKVNISGHTYEMVKDFFICEYRGKMPVKYKGDIDMYFVKGIRPELSLDLKLIPDKKFFVQLQILRLLDLEELVINKLNYELPAKMYFHNSRYTIDVYTLVELIGRAEGLSQEELLLVRTAALFINMGFISLYDGYEKESVKFAQEILPKYKYSDEQIEIVCSLILAVRFPDIAKNQSEAILMDACFNYLGRVDYLQYSLNHFKEVKERVSSLTEKEWFYHDLRFVEQHHFYTNTAKTLREISIEEQVQKIKEFAKFNESTIKP
jgi:class 3 adenylate cyclase